MTTRVAECTTLTRGETEGRSERRERGGRIHEGLGVKRGDKRRSGGGERGGGRNMRRGEKEGDGEGEVYLCMTD